MPKWDTNSALGKLAFLTHIKARDCSVARACGHHRGRGEFAGGGRAGVNCSVLKDDTQKWVVGSATREANMREGTGHGNACLRAGWRVF